MDLYKLGKISPEEFLFELESLCNTNNFDSAIKLLKKSGISINYFGSGKPKKIKLYKEAIDLLKNKNPSKIQEIKKLENEVYAINQLYFKLATNFLSKLENLIPDKIHLNSYVICMELFLSKDIYNLKHQSALNNNQSDYFENSVESIGLVLKYLLFYKDFSFENENIRIDFNYIQDAITHLEYAGYKSLLNILYELWSYFEVEIDIIENLVLAKAKGNKTLGKTISHLKFLDVRQAKQARYAHEQYLLYGNNSTINKTRKLPPHGYASYDERMAVEFVKEYFSTDDFNSEIFGIKISEFVRAYMAISIECKSFLESRKTTNLVKKGSISLNDICIVKSKKKWTYLMIEWGIQQKNASKIFDLLIFNEKSEDCIDAPFLRLEENYMVIPSISVSTDPVRALLSNLKCKNVEVKIKGDWFEIQMRKTLVESGINCIQLKNPDYECDIVFSLDEDLFFIEVKHLNDPTSYKQYIENNDKIIAATVQLNRIVNYYTKAEKLVHVKQLLKIDNVKNIYKIILTNTAQGENSKINDTYI
ncbi:hypothetical protein, partial [Paenibacillus nuruki]|uniref:hypothetical protein n=1 Tax=Paenibacillus nuruki TaxID=1886670 RepID=UPI000847D181